MELNMKQIFSKRLVMARKLAGLSLEELSDIAHISKQTLCKYEKEQVTPNGESIMSLSKAFNVKPDYFFTNSPEPETMGNINFREEYKHDEAEMRRVKVEALSKIESYLLLEKIANETTEFQNPIEDFVITSQKDAKRAANVVRKRWKLGNAPIHKVVDVLEDNGVKIIEFQCSASFEGLSGFFWNVPVIVINVTIDENTRKRFTLLHELGHLILKIDENLIEDGDLIEKICNSFAGALLIPDEIILNEFRNRKQISLQELISIKEKYGASIMVILVSAALLKIISWDAYNAWKVEGLKCDGGHYDILEKSDRMSRLARKCLSENRITIDKAILLTGLDRKDIFDSDPTFIKTDGYNPQ